MADEIEQLAEQFEGASEMFEAAGMSIEDSIRAGDVVAPWPDSPQWEALSTDADIVIFGGAAGGGKSYGMLLAAARGFEDPAYRGVIFRRTYPQLSAPGGLIDESDGLYGDIKGAEYKAGQHEWHLPSGAWLKFSHMQRESDRKSWDGAQLTFVGFDQLEQFTQLQFLYMLGRMRSPDSTHEPQLFATCNPTGEDHWLYDFVQWWLDEEGFPDPKKAGDKRHFFREDDTIRWVDADATDETGLGPTSVAFVPATVQDNPALMEDDPQYLQRLNSLGRVDRQQKKHGQWGVSFDEGVYKDHRVTIVESESVPDSLPLGRYWDLADNDGRGAATASVKAGMTWESRWCCQHAGDERGEGDCLAEFTEEHEECPECGHDEVIKEKKPVLWVLDMTEWWLEGAAKEKRMEMVARQDGSGVDQALEQEPGSSGKRVVESYADGMFADHETHIDNPTGDKTSRARPVVPAAERGRVRIVEAKWNTLFLDRIEGFPLEDEKDVPDALHGVWGLLESGEIRGERGWGFTF